MIEAALAAEDRAMVEATRELGLFARMAGQYRGRAAWVNGPSRLGLLAPYRARVLVGLTVLHRSPLLAVAFRGILLAGTILAIGMVKLDPLSKIETDRGLGELKRVELMLAARGQQDRARIGRVDCRHRTTIFLSRDKGR